MESQLRKNLEERLQNLEKEVYLVFPECHSPNVREAVNLLDKYPKVKTIPLSAELLKSKGMEDLVESFLPEYEEATRNYYEKQVKKGKMDKKDWESFNREKARKELCDPLNFALMMARKNYADAEVGGVEATTAEHTRRALYLVNKDPRKENIVCSCTMEFLTPVKLEDKGEGTTREIRFLTLADPALGKPAMEYGFVTSEKLLKSMKEGNLISEESYQKSIAKVEEEKRGYIRLKCDQAISALVWHKFLTQERPIGAFLCHSTAGSDQASLYVQFLRQEVIPAIVKALEEEKKHNPLLKDAVFISQECQVEAASDPRIGRKKAKGEAYAGYANVHLLSAVDTGNQHYKTFLTFTEMDSMICWSGFLKPIYDLSRSSPVKDIVLSALVAATQAIPGTAFAEKEKWQQKIYEMNKNL
ncbi:MAG: hypothetical protein HUU50_00020 [Candidatus Brocadiae bacterium]|nr:hypothetical protein [Candidatus Brocadiia bacterium]